ncbi:HNH endonuclease [Erythrobacter sp. SG61-1L]|uniref:HNH endonuclease n=1 Tax=Erythrobacter sp. SG61-1L TaxID=1603897 RepID=UPI0018F89E72|nr:HNH endonuclease [Erythrobacter sp. SG61-1L]
MRTALIFNQLWCAFMAKIQKIRHSRFVSQQGKCFYCQQPMWEGNPEVFARDYHLSHRQAEFLRSTAEHLVARSEGGGNSASNIVAACHFCNSRRHWGRTALAPESYARKVRARLAKGKWHGLLVLPFEAQGGSASISPEACPIDIPTARQSQSMSG